MYNIVMSTGFVIVLQIVILIFYWLLGQMCHEGCYWSILNTCDIAPSHSEGTTVRKKEELVTCMI